MDQESNASGSSTHVRTLWLPLSGKIFCNQLFNSHFIKHLDILQTICSKNLKHYFLLLLKLEFCYISMTIIKTY